jgi:archaemetzincin
MRADGPPPAIADLELFELAPHPDRLGPELAAHLSQRLGLPCRLAAAPADFLIPELSGRNQIDADRLLQVVESLPLARGRVRIAMTHRDMGHPIFTHFFGRARHGGPAVLVSTARLDPTFYGLPPDRALLLARATREIMHELGHAGGVGHCEDWTCVMHFAATVEDLELRGEAYCQRCLAALPTAMAGRGRPP